MASPSFVAGDTGSSISATLRKTDGTIIDLTGYSAAFTFEVDGGLLLAKKTVAMTISAPPTSGIVTYQFAAIDLPTQTVLNKSTSTLTGEISITDDTGKVTTSLGFVSAIIRNRLT